MVRGPNAANEVVGATVIPDAGIRAFLLTSDRFENLKGLPGTDWSSAHGTNDIGGVVGSSNAAVAVRAFRWTRPTGAQELSPLPGDSVSEAFGINRHNEVAGYSSGPSGVQATIWNSNGQIEGIGRLLEGDQSRGLAVNERSEVVGISGSSRGMRAFRWRKGEGMQDLGTLQGHDNSSAYGINSQGQVVGFSDGITGPRAFLWELNKGMESLGTLTGAIRAAHLRLMIPARLSERRKVLRDLVLLSGPARPGCATSMILLPTRAISCSSRRLALTIGEPSLRLVVTRMRMEVRTPIMSFQRGFCS